MISQKTLMPFQDNSVTGVQVLWCVSEFQHSARQLWAFSGFKIFCLYILLCSLSLFFPCQGTIIHAESFFLPTSQGTFRFPNGQIKISGLGKFVYLHPC